jgi:hypothetical protein
MNSFIPDPIATHRQYCERLRWTEAEKQIFIDKGRLHPQEFKKIPAGLSHKSVKEQQLKKKRAETRYHQRRSQEVSGGNVREIGEFGSLHKVARG